MHSETTDNEMQAERSERMLLEATSEGDEDVKGGNCSWNGLDCAEAAVDGRLGWLMY